MNKRLTTDTIMRQVKLLSDHSLVIPSSLSYLTKLKFSVFTMIKSILEKKKATIDVSLKLLFLTKIVKVCFKVKESVLCIWLYK